MAKYINIIGETFGYLTVINRSDDVGNGKKPVVKYECICTCGQLVTVKGESLRSGHTVSCGCKKVKHNLSNKERLYNIWKCMRQRCNNPNNPRFSHYGGMGVKICVEWNDYLMFRSWALANGYADNLSIDRIDVNGNYEPSNCRWATNKIQANNQTRNRMISYKGRNYTMSELADSLDLSYSALQHRIERGWTIERIVSQKQR